MLPEQRLTLAKTVNDFRDNGSGYLCVAQAGWHAEVLKKLHGALQGSVNSLIGVSGGYIPDPAGELKQFARFGTPLVI